MFVRTSTHRRLIEAERQRLTDAVIAWTLGALFWARAHEGQVTAIRAEVIASRNEVAGLEGRIVALNHRDGLPASAEPTDAVRIRWVTRRKIALLNFIDAGLMTETEAALRYAVSGAELREWRNTLSAYGRAGLNALWPTPQRRERQA